MTGSVGEESLKTVQCRLDLGVSNTTVPGGRAFRTALVAAPQEVTSSGADSRGRTTRRTVGNLRLGVRSTYFLGVTSSFSFCARPAEATPIPSTLV